MTISSTYYTKDQLQIIMDGWGCIEPIPKKNARLIVCWPKPQVPDTAVITYSDKKSPDGKRLYLVVMGMFDEVIGDEFK